MRLSLLLGLFWFSTSVLSVPNEGEYSPAWSPDGKYLAYHQNSEKIVWDIMLKEIETGKIIQVTKNNGYDTGASWSPDSKKLVFSSSRGGNRDIYIFDLMSGETSKIIEHDAMDNQAKWSPKGDKIAFLSRRNGNSQIYLYDVKSQSIDQITNEPEPIYHPSWSNEGKSIIFDMRVAEKSGIYQVELKSRKVEKIFQNGASLISAKRYQDTIWVTTNINGNWDIISVDLESGKTKNIVASQNNEIKAVLDHSGKKIAYSKQQDTGTWRIETKSFH